MAIVSEQNKPRFPVCSHTEFNRLRSVIVGSARGANHPNPDDPSFVNFFMPPADGSVRARAAGPIPSHIIEEIEEDLEGLIRLLGQFDVQVFRPELYDSTVSISAPGWTTQQLYSLMPRDCMLVIGNTLIEPASSVRARYFEMLPFRKIFYEHRKQFPFRWICAPRPELSDRCFGENPLESTGKGKLLEHEILFDGANCVRIGRDIFIDINRSANLLALDWLQRDVLGEAYRVHPMQLGLDHADVTLIPIRPGLLLVDPVRVRPQDIPPPLKSWDVIRIQNLPEMPFGLSYPLASNGIGRNVLMLNPDTAVVSNEQLELIAELERRKITVIPLRYRHGRTLGGSFHCVTLDLHREGDSEAVSYL